LRMLMLWRRQRQGLRRPSMLKGILDAAIPRAAAPVISIDAAAEVAAGGPKKGQATTRPHQPPSRHCALCRCKAAMGAAPKLAELTGPPKIGSGNQRLLAFINPATMVMHLGLCLLHRVTAPASRSGDERCAPEHCLAADMPMAAPRLLPMDLGPRRLSRQLLCNPDDHTAGWSIHPCWYWYGCVVQCI
jgi:hypothetical protein